MLGYVVRTPMGFAIRYELNGPVSHGRILGNGSDDEQMLQFGADAIKVGEQIFLTEPDGSRLRFRIANLH